MTTSPCRYDLAFDGSADSPMWIPYGPAMVTIPGNHGWIETYNLQYTPLVASPTSCAKVHGLEHGMPRIAPLPDTLNSKSSSNSSVSDDTITGSPCEPVASEETWAQRIAKRIDAIHHMKVSEIYGKHQDSTDLVDARPQTPNALDRSLSKREWESQVGKWRSEWRTIDGITSLVEQGYDEQASRDAWSEAEKVVKELHKAKKRQAGSEYLSQDMMQEKCKCSAIQVLSDMATT